MTQAPTSTERTEKPQTQLATKFQYQPMVKVGNATGLKGLGEIMKASIAAVLPKHVTPERMVKALLVAGSNTPKLFDCTQESIVRSLMAASSLGLDCSGILGSGYLVPFKKNTKDATGKWQSRMECQFIPGYRGLIDLARRGGQIATIAAHCVYAQDQFQLEYGTEEKVVHVPYLLADRRDEIIGVYAVAILRDGTKQTEFMTLADINRVRDDVFKKNRVSEPSGPWADHYGEMARKTVVRRLCKYLPLSPELEQAIDQDDRAGREMAGEIIDSAAIDNTHRTEALADRLAGESAVVDEETGEVIDTPEPETAPAQGPESFPPGELPLKSGTDARSAGA
jgi:recombination protein RecT